MLEAEILQEFQKLFRGRVDAWGSVTGKANKEQVTDEHYQRHLEGKVSLGVYPLLDDATCYFFAIDLDIRDWLQISAVRDALAGVQIPAYISASKSKGYHLWVFAEENEPFVAKDARRLALAALNKIGVEAEIFPKQDELDEITPLGNYINIPAFGAFSTLPTRPFLDKNQHVIPLAVFLNQVKRTPRARIAEAAKELPPLVVPQVLQPKTLTAKAKRGTSKHPPCVDELQKGVTHGVRDVAAFALARHYLDQSYSSAEVLGLLLVWDRKNSPPIGQKDLITKIASAEKGYAFGCKSIKDQPLLASMCVGETLCDWLRAAVKDKRKKGLVSDQSFYETPDYLYEEIQTANNKTAFLAFNKATGETKTVTEIEENGITIMPIFSPEITEGAVTLPTGVEEYGDTVALVQEIQEFIHRYVDVKPVKEQLSAWYIVMSWVYDRLPALAYLRFNGDTGTGKSRSLDVIGRLCYKPMMMAGAVTPAPIYRLIRRFRGTLILEEADLKDSTEKSEVVTILNCGFERGRPVIRCSQENPDNLEILPCFGPKVFATRYKFSDIALEARCITLKLEETDRQDIPPLLGNGFHEGARHLRNKLLLWRLRHLLTVDPNDIEKVDIGPLEPRLKQIGIPFALPFHNLPEVMTMFRNFMREYGEELKEERGESDNGRVVISLFKLALAHGRHNVGSEMIANDLNEEFKMGIDKRIVGKVLGSLNIKKSLRRVPGSKRARCIKWELELMKKLLRRYITDPEEYAPLLKEDDIDMEI